MITDGSKYDASSFHDPRRLNSFGKKYSVFVRVMKLILPVIALVIAGVVISYLSGNETSNRSLSAIPKEEKTIPGQIELVGAKYEGVDEKGSPYTITADKANRSVGEEDGVLFENPLADIFLANKTWIALKSKGGIFNRIGEELMLEEAVKAFHDSGYEIDMSDIIIDLKKGTASTARPVTVKGPMGSASAQSMEVKDSGNKVIFYGPIYLKVFNLSLLRGQK